MIDGGVLHGTVRDKRVVTHNVPRDVFEERAGLVRAREARMRTTRPSVERSIPVVWLDHSDRGQYRIEWLVDSAECHGRCCVNATPLPWPMLTQAIFPSVVCPTKRMCSRKHRSRSLLSLRERSVHCAAPVPNGASRVPIVRADISTGSETLSVSIDVDRSSMDCSRACAMKYAVHVDTMKDVSLPIFGHRTVEARQFALNEIFHGD